MNLAKAFELAAEFLGFLLVSGGGTLSAIAVLLVLARIGLGRPDTGLVPWLNLVYGSGLSGVAMLAAGISLVRRSK